MEGHGRMLLQCLLWRLLLLFSLLVLVMNGTWFPGGLHFANNEKKFYKSRAHLGLCFDGGYHVMDEAVHESSVKSTNRKERSIRHSTLRAWVYKEQFSVLYRLLGFGRWDGYRSSGSCYNQSQEKRL